jgi:hypothetical protein
MFEEVLERLVKVDASLLQRHGVEIGKPPVLATVFGNCQKWLEIMLGGQLVATDLVAMPPDRQRLVEDETHGAELPIEEAGLLLVGVDADFGGTAHLRRPYAPAFLAARIEILGREILAMRVIKAEANPEVRVFVPADNHNSTTVRVGDVDDLSSRNPRQLRGHLSVDALGASRPLKRSSGSQCIA